MTYMQVHFSCNISVEFSCENLLLKFRPCAHHSQQSKPYFEPLTFAKLRYLLKLEYFDFVCLHFHGVFLTLFAYIFHYNEFEEDKFSLAILQTRWTVFVQRLLNWLWRAFSQAIESFVFLHRALWDFCNQSQIKHVLVPSCCRYVTKKNWFMLNVRISVELCTWDVWRALKKLEFPSLGCRLEQRTLTLLSCSPTSRLYP